MLTFPVAVVEADDEVLEEPARRVLPQRPLLLHKLEQRAAVGVLEHDADGLLGQKHLLQGVKAKEPSNEPSGEQSNEQSNDQVSEQKEG